MNSRISRWQTAFVLVVSFLLLFLFVGGLWVYVSSADAETEVQEASASTIPADDKLSIIWERYDRFPIGDVDQDKEYNRFQGSGLNASEAARLPDLLQAYARGKRPVSKVPSLPYEECFAVIPLDPKSYGGQTEYYLLPEKVLTDEQLLMLIDYSAQKGEAFGLETTNWKNCMREGFPSSNRYLSAGEILRCGNLLDRMKTEGLRPLSPELVQNKLPVSGVGGIKLNKKLNSNNGSFHLYPLRELTDEELMQTLYLDYLDGFEYINPSMDKSLDPIADRKRMRAIFKDIANMPESAIDTELTYRRSIATGEIHMHSEFVTATVNGVSTHYYAIEKMSTGEILQYSRSKVDASISNTGYIADLPNADISFADDHWKEIAQGTISKLTPMKITRINGSGVSATRNGQHLSVQVVVILEDRSCYEVSISVDDDMVNYAHYLHHDVKMIDDYVW